MSSEKVPKDLGGGYARRGIEIRIEWDLTGDVHGDRVPGVNSSDELIKLYLRFPAAISCIFLDDRGDVPLAVAQRCRGVKRQTIVRRRSSPVAESLVLGCGTRIAAARDDCIPIPVKDQN